MNNIKTIKIHGEPIPVEFREIEIEKLKFLTDNPRVYSCTHAVENFEQKIESEQQEIIYERLLEEPSVKKLIPDIKHHEGLMEPILVRIDRMEVIEGNSRLAVYKNLYEVDKSETWERIQCIAVSGLTEEQLSAYLHKIHVKGKTEWSAYEKANFAYVRIEKGWSKKKVAQIFDESPQTITIRYKVIDLMKKNNDLNRENFSYYDVLVRNSNISNKMKKDEKFSDYILNEIKFLDNDNKQNKFTAQEMRKKLPAVLNKPKVLKKLIKREINLDTGYQRAKISDSAQRVRKARGHLEDIAKEEVLSMNNNDFNAFNQDFKKLKRCIRRIDAIINIRLKK